MSDVNFSIVIPSYNRPSLALRAIKSAQMNMVSGDELWLVNDGSIESYEQVEDYCAQDASLNYIFAKNEGVSSARNIGISHAKHDFVALLDDDDEWLKGHLEAHRSIYKAKPELIAVFSDFYNGQNESSLKPAGISNWSQHTRNIRTILDEWENNPTSHNVYTGQLYSAQCSADYIPPFALSFNKSRLGSDLKFQVGLKRNETWLFSSSCCKQGDVAFVDASLAKQNAANIPRGTGISAEETMLSRLYVMSKLWARDTSFLAKNKQEFTHWYFNDFYGVFRGAVSMLKPSLLWQAYRIVGLRYSLKFTLRSIASAFRRQKPIYRNA